MTGLSMIARRCAASRSRSEVGRRIEPGADALEIRRLAEDVLKVVQESS